MIFEGVWRYDQRGTACDQTETERGAGDPVNQPPSPENLLSILRTAPSHGTWVPLNPNSN